MSTDVSYTNIVSKQVPQTVDEFVSFINYIKNHPDPVFMQISGVGVESVRRLADLLGTNFFDVDHASSLNPFTVIYIDQEGTIKSNMINEKSKIIVYATRSVSNH